MHSVVWVWPDYTVRATPRIIELKSTTKHTKRPWNHFCGHSSPVVAHTPPQTRKGRCPVAEQLFGMNNIRIHHIALELCLLEKKEKRKKEDERN